MDPRDGRSAGAAAPPSLVHELLDDTATRTPDAVAVVDAVGELTYRELARLSVGFAHWLRGRGVAAGERLVTQLPSDRRLVAMFYGASRAGVVFVPLNPAMKEFHLVSVFANAQPALVLADAPSVGRLGRISPAPVHDLAEIWDEVRSLADRPAEPVEVRPDDVAVLIYTSGSTAAPKAVIGPHAQVVFACRAIQQVLGYRPDDVVFCRFPLSWDYGLYKVLLCCLGGSRIVLAGEESDLVLLSRMRETGATVVPIVPSLATMITTMAPRHRELPRVRMFTNTGAALPATTIAALREFFPGTRVVRQFGQTECKRVSIMPPERDGELPLSVGLPLPGTTVHILDDDGAPVPTGDVGEIVVSGPHVMPGYWRMPELSARTFRPDPDGAGPRLHTGDYGCLDADGYLYFEGRRDDMFKRKGIRMGTLEIEAAAMDILGVRAAAVLPPDGDRDLVIFVESDDLAPHVVLKELAQRLELAKVPAICRVLPQLPMTLHGKNARDALTRLLDGEPA
ncbi:AMP-binding protein [Micromonospora sp. NBC_01699]|uniref:AMP-binding protein n=1 Tax=Micromonospora sp. NBC_01699 TaxID=2975984 RepID=UPI002E282EC4|nr:AMP-binding protein [Micromonospora sp. NBC_01699]